jgi:hypothetical protein
VPLVRRGSERGAQLLLNGLLDRPADGLVDQLAERDVVTSNEAQVPGTFLHGRIPPVRPGVVPGVLNTRENAPSSISTRTGTRPEFLSLDDILEIHRDQIERYGGELSIRDRGLLESAVAMPQQSFGGEYLHPDIFEMAAAYAFHLAEN